MEILIDSVTKEDDGTISVHVTVKSNGEVLQHLSAQGQSKDEIKDKLRPKIVAIRQNENARQLLRGTAQQALDELKTELGITQ